MEAAAGMVSVVWTQSETIRECIGVFSDLAGVVGLDVGAARSYLTVAALAVTGFTVVTNSIANRRKVTIKYRGNPAALRTEELKSAFCERFAGAIDAIDDVTVEQIDGTNNHNISYRVMFHEGHPSGDQTRLAENGIRGQTSQKTSVTVTDVRPGCVQVELEMNEVVWLVLIHKFAAGCPKLAEVWEGFDAAAADKDHTLGEPQHISFEGSALKAVLITGGTAEGLKVRAKAAAKEESLSPPDADMVQGGPSVRSHGAAVSCGGPCGQLKPRSEFSKNQLENKEAPECKVCIRSGMLAILCEKGWSGLDRLTNEEIIRMLNDQKLMDDLKPNKPERGFVGPLGQIKSAGVLPCMRTDQVEDSSGGYAVDSRTARRSGYRRGGSTCDVKVLIQVEDMQLKKDGEKVWVPSYAMFGGKFQEGDVDWVHTCIREFCEETGVAEMAMDSDELTADIRSCSEHSAWVEKSKYQAILMDKTSDNFSFDGQWAKLPEFYEATFKGRTSYDTSESDYKRAARRLEWVSVTYNEDSRKFVVGNNTLPVKRELDYFMKTELFKKWFHNKPTNAQAAVNLQLAEDGGLGADMVSKTLPRREDANQAFCDLKATAVPSE